MQRRRQRTGRVEISLGYACSNDCVFCSETRLRRQHSAEATGGPVTTERIRQAMDRLRVDGGEHLTLLGGEPTIRKDFIGLLDYAKDIGFERVSMTTNGRRFADPEFAREVARRSILRITVSLHGPTAAIHDAITQRPGAYDEVITGLQNLHEAGMPVDLTAVICRQNQGQLALLYDLHRSHNPGRMLWVFVRPVGEAYDRFEDIVPPMADIAAELQPVLDRATKEAAPLLVGHMPLCMLPGNEGAADELYWHDDTAVVLREIQKFLAAKDSGKGSYQVTFDHFKMKTKACGGCRFVGVCAGLFKEYIERRGAFELRPVAGTAVKSFSELRLPYLLQRN